MVGTAEIKGYASIGAFVAALACAIALVSAPAESAYAGGKCAKADAAPRNATPKQMGKAVHCLIGKERRAAGLKPVEKVGSLTRVARKHTKVMVETDCLDHRCKGEKPLNTRIVNSGYPIPGGRYGFAEVTGCSLTPRAMVNAWMDKRVYRKRLLGEEYRDVGIGSAKARLDVEGCDDGPVRGIYTVIFGWRKR